jgi:hypothetical protein
MLKTAAGALAGMLVTFGTGCANTVAAHRPLSEENLAEVNDSLGGREARVTLAGVPPAEPLPAKDVKVGRDTTQWLELQRGTEASRLRTVPTAALQRISIKRRDLGALVGGAVGANVGSAVGAIVAAALAQPSCGVGACGGFGYVVVGDLIGLLAGAGVGAMLGAGIGHTTTVEFDPPGKVAPPTHLPSEP